MSNYVHNKNYIKRKRTNQQPPKNSGEKKKANCPPSEVRTAQRNGRIKEPKTENNSKEKEQCIRLATIPTVLFLVFFLGGVRIVCAYFVILPFYYGVQCASLLFMSRSCVSILLSDDD